MERFWVWLCRFSARRIVIGKGEMPCGIPTIRDPDAKCTGYEPRKRKGGDWDCVGDGHYLCKECCHLAN